MTVLGIDISHWNTPTPSLTGLGFVIVKATEGTATQGVGADVAYKTHMAKVLAAGKLAGAYIFGRNDISLDEQAKFFVAHAQGATFLAVDNEGRHVMPQDRTRYLINRIKAHDTLGRQVGLYMSESGFQEAGQDFDWVANWSGQTPHHAYLIWQYHGGPLDKDRYELSLAQLRAALAPYPPAPDSSIDPPAGVPPMNQGMVIHDTLVTVPAGKYLHVNSGMGADADNVKAPTGGLRVPLVWNDGAGKFRIVEYQGKGWWVYWADISNMGPAPEPVDPTPFDQADLDEAVTTTKAKAYVAWRP